MNNKEAIEKALNRIITLGRLEARKEDFADGILLDECVTVAEEALTLLKQQPKCKTCGGSGNQYCPVHGTNSCPSSGVGCKGDIVACPVCQQPEASKFTKRFRELIELSKAHLSNNKIGRLQTYSKEACDLLDQLTANLKESESRAVMLNKVITDLNERTKELEAMARCPCGGKLVGIGYDRKDKRVVFDCKCGAQLLLSHEVWKKILKDNQ